MPSRSVCPESVGRFRVEAILGSGGMGEVYKAIDPMLQRIVAVKTVRPDIDNPEYLDRLLREAQTCASLHHPNIVTVYEAGKIDGAVYLVMEYLEGEDLAQVLNRGGLNFDERIRVLIQVLDALDHAHSMGVVHRDIKPSNVRMLPSGQIKLVDFGLARMAKAATLTATGMVMGTPHYASPEQLRGEPTDRRSDIYSAGTMAYEMCSGRRPFEGENNSLTTIILKVISEPPPPMDGPWSRSFPQIERIINRAMAKSREDRYQTAEDMKNALAAFLSASRDLITALQAQETVIAQRTVIEAQGLLASGNAIDAQTLLSATLKVNPQAAGVRQLLDDIATRFPPPTPAPGLDDPPTPAPRAMTPPLVVARTPTAPKSKMLWWAGGFAAVAASVAAVIALGGSKSPSVDQEPVNRPADSRTLSTPAVVTQPPVIESAKSSAPATTAPPPSNTALPVASPATAATAVPSAAPPTGTSAPARAVALPPAGVGAKTLFYGDPKLVAPNEIPHPGPTGLRYRMTQASDAGTETDVDPASAIFRSGDRVRLSFESNVDGYLYVVQEGSSGRWDVLFPHPDSNGGRNTLRRGVEYVVPPDGWFQFDDNVGTELLFVVLSKEPLTELPGFAKPGAQPERLDASVVESVQKSIRPRDLTFARDARPQPGQGGKLIQANYVVNRAELGKSVAVTLTLKHQ